jgi:hypothetical protein
MSQEQSGVAGNGLEKGISADAMNELYTPYQFLKNIREGVKATPEAMDFIRTPLVLYAVRMPERQAELGSPEEASVRRFDEFVNQYNEALQTNPDDLDGLYAILEKAVEELSVN